MYTTNYIPDTPLKSVFIAYNQAYHPLLLRLLRRLSIKGYTNWVETPGQGTDKGEPHLGSHAWPTMNSSMLVIVPEAKVGHLLKELRALDEATPEQGLRAFVWSVEQTI